MRRATIAAATTGLALLGGAAQAHASTVAVQFGCYLSGAPISTAETGFTPGGPVNFSFDGQLSSSGVADGAGNLAQPLTAPVLDFNVYQHQYSLAAQDQTNPALAATTPVFVTQRTVTMSPKQGRPKKKIKFGVHALNPGQPVYLHYIFKKKQRYRKRLGVAKAPCGALTKRTRFFPVNRPRTGIWTFQFDNKKRYSKHSLPRVLLKIQIFSVFR
jgi:hypothetical protein